MFLRPSLVLFTITQAALTGAAARGTDVLTAPPAFQPTDTPSPALSYTLSCPGCQTIPIITTDNIYTTTSTTTVTTTAPLDPIQTEYGQCGGIGWEGPTICKSPYTCETSRAWMKEYLETDQQLLPMTCKTAKAVNPRPRIKANIQIFWRVTADLQFVNVIVKLPMGPLLGKG
ncbi:hypothetical protein B0H10DRAFT_1962570 [Mycena sp. CBHHK59/15]|nr:hypothetical protein B0H10DRAFT_1962570 [Mycena sp. CBHHK59/15]